MGAYSCSSHRPSGSWRSTLGGGRGMGRVPVGLREGHDEGEWVLRPEE